MISDGATESASDALVDASGAFESQPKVTTAEYAAQWLSALCGQVTEVRCAAVVLGPPNAGPFVPAAIWPHASEPTPLLADAAERAIESRSPVVLEGEGSVGIGQPIVLNGYLYGTVALELPSSQQKVTFALRQIAWGLGGLESALQRGQSMDTELARERLLTLLNFVATSLNEASFAAAANALATELSLQLHCDRVGIGFRRAHISVIAAVSNSADFEQRMNLIQALAQAMDEAIDQNALIAYPRAAEEVLVTRDHAALARQHGSDSILTIPFNVEPDVLGAFTFERSASLPFDQDTIELCQGVVSLCARLLQQKRLNERSWWLRVKDAAHAELARFIGPRHFGRKLIVAISLVIIVFLLFATGPYRVGANASLEGAVRRVLVAPFDGYLETAPHRAGDVVKEGTVIATLDQRDLQLEYLKAESQYEQYYKQVQEQDAQHDRAQSAIVTAQAEQAKAQMDLLTDEMAHASIVSPLDGLVVSGDLNQSLGSAIKRGQVLFEVSPLDQYRVVLEVQEEEIDAVKVGQRGMLVLTSLPGAEFPMTVQQMTPVTTSKEGHSYFRVEAVLDHVDARLRPGMDGVGKIDTGRRHYFWIWTHRLVDWVELTTWAWL